ncbi:hypothetical protein VNO80_01407 [Phaseolus coccineus]|uniref:Alpha-L-arabinofuranosidase C-terminal domain-containing protein n=1 Tax=Phaseolus coccineus TaxID=3886 RepID=A0AAN9RSU6_PHACN
MTDRIRTLLAAVAEAAFLIGLEKNSDAVHMVSYAPLFVNTNDKRWTPDAIVFNSHESYGTPSYWLQHLFTTSSGATLLDSTLQTSSKYIVASAIEYTNATDKNKYLRVKVVNFDSDPHNFRFSVTGLDSKVQPSGATKTVITAPNVKEENSFSEPNKIVPQHTSMENASADMNVLLAPYSSRRHLHRQSRHHTASRALLSSRAAPVAPSSLVAPPQSRHHTASRALLSSRAAPVAPSSAVTPSSPVAPPQSRPPPQSRRQSLPLQSRRRQCRGCPDRAATCSDRTTVPCSRRNQERPEQELPFLCEPPLSHQTVPDPCSASASAASHLLCRTNQLPSSH